MPSAAPRITLVFPNHAGADLINLPSLARICARGDGWQHAEVAERGSLNLWQMQWLRASSLAIADHPSAPLTWLAHGDAGERVWLHLDPVHLALSIDGLAMHVIPQWTEAEMAQLEAPLRVVCEAAGFSWHRAAINGRLHIFLSTDALGIDTVAPGNAMHTPLRLNQARGSDAQRLMQLRTEIEMTLHEQPILEARAARNEFVANSVWLWGEGRVANSLRAESKLTLPRCYTEEPYALGAYLAHGERCERLPADVDAVIAQASGTNVIAIVPAINSDEVEAQWLAPALHALRARQWHELHCCFNDGEVRITRAQDWRFWRRAPRKEIA